MIDRAATEALGSDAPSLEQGRVFGIIQHTGVTLLHPFQGKRRLAHLEKGL